MNAYSSTTFISKGLTGLKFQTWVLLPPEIFNNQMFIAIHQG